ncbi:PREDICTED: uveal autoantigen with coiled-coil domains and ankyrin repeats [Nanorana parkeri]|uniref:uveal autoantigen with coiled-coil domains and ankyrin repeats n=1 Tax=Nanorana parkeri TaxID=125878 RepID=UPI0008543196|nr:PREDICTED: uveal autoantigen with coiled-coil domains and ankyrin repeats [Nanorana parkeri]
MTPWFTCSSKHKQTAEWSKYDDRLMKAAERGDVEKITSTLTKKGVNPSKLDLEGRSAFHVVSSKGHLECLNSILLHGVDLTAPDAVGRNALHLSAKYGHSLCLQKLLQFNCPTENVDLQGRTALHDAAMSDCCSSVQLLCDHGAFVNAKDLDGRTPLALATQMCRPGICQLLIDKGADINARDKQNKTPLMLGCEYGCKEAVEVLLRAGADVGLVDALGHDCSYYSRIGDNQEILSLIRIAVESSPRGPDPLRSKVSLRAKWAKANSKEETLAKSKDHSQDLEVENEDLRDKLRKMQLEQRSLLDKVGGFQLQLNQEQMITDDLENEKEELKSLLEAKEKELEGGLRTMENLRGKMRYYEQKNHSAPNSPFRNLNSPFSPGKEEVVMKQNLVLSTDPQHAAHLPARSQLRPLELPGENSDQRQELETIRRYYELAREEVMRRQEELSRRSSECVALATERDRSKAESDQQIRQLEEALRDVQKRMLDSESKVKQMQTHFLALKDHLTQEALSGSSRAEDLQEQLREVKGKYEGASAEVGKLRNQLRHNELLGQELRREDARLRKDNRRLQDELAICEEEKEKAERRAQEAGEQLKLAVTTDKFENMRCLLTNEVNEKSLRLEEVEQELSRVRDEFEAANKEKRRSEPKLDMLRKELNDLKVRNSSLARESEKLQSEKILLQRQAEELRAQMRSQHVPAQLHAETKRACEETIALLSQKLAESEQNHRKTELEQEKLVVERKTLKEGMVLLQASTTSRQEHETEVKEMQSRIKQLEKQLADMNKKWEEEAKRACALLSENASLKENHIPLATHLQASVSLTAELEKAKSEVVTVRNQLENETKQVTTVQAELEKQIIKQKNLQVQLDSESAVKLELQTQLKTQTAKAAELQEKLRAEVSENAELHTLTSGEASKRAELQSELDKLKEQISSNYVARKEHEDKVAELQKCEENMKQECLQTYANYQHKKEEVIKLQAAIKEQRAELDTLQRCITEKYAPLTSMEEKEKSFLAERKELELELQKQCQITQEAKEGLSKQQQETLDLRKELAISKQTLLQEQTSRKEEEAAMLKELNELRACLQDLQRTRVEADEKQCALQEENLQSTRKLNALQECLSSQYIPIQNHNELKTTLDNTRATLEAELSAKVHLYENMQEKVRDLQKELEEQRGSCISNAQYTEEKEDWHRREAAAQAKLQEKEEALLVAKQEMKRLQEELNRAQQKLEEVQNLRQRENVDFAAVRTALEQRVALLEDTSSKYREENKQMAQKLQDALTQCEKVKQNNQSQEQEITQLKGKHELCLSTIDELQESIQKSARDLEIKDKQVSVLLKDIEKLKKSLSLLPAKSHSTELLQNQLKALQGQLDEMQRRHQEIISIYRAHLLNAVQGHMDADVQDALLQIIHMRQELVC